MRETTQLHHFSGSPSVQRRARSRRLTMIMLVAASAGCASEREPSREELDAAVSPSSPGRDAALGLAPADAAASTFAVDIRADRVSLCAGECAALSADVLHGGRDLRYSWSHNLPAAATASVCPTESTSYSVDVTSTLGAGEFQHDQTAQDSLTISVRDCSKPERQPVLCEFRHRFERPTGGDLFQAKKPWINAASGSMVESTEDGHSYWAGSYGVRFDVGSGALMPKASMEGFVQKFDPSCKPLWSRALQATNPGDITMVSSIDSDLQGNVYVSALSAALLRLDPLLPFPIGFVNEVVVYKLSPSGDVLYRSRFPVLSGYAMDISVDEQGRAYVSAMLSALTDLGNGPIGLVPTTFHSVLIALDADGKHRATKVNTGSYTSEPVGDQVIYPRYGRQQFDVLAALLGVPDLGANHHEPPALIGVAQSDLSARWTHAFDLMPHDNDYITQLTSAARGGAIGLLQSMSFEQRPGENVQTSRVAIARIDSNGQFERSTPLSTVEYREPLADAGAPTDSDASAPVEQSLSLPGAAVMAAHAQGGMAFGGGYFGNVKVGDIILTDPTNATHPNFDFSHYQGMPLYVARVDAQDKLAWARTLAWGKHALLAGLGIDAAGQVTVLGEARVNGAQEPTGAAGETAETDIVMQRLRAE